MAFYDWLEGVSDAIDEKFYETVRMVDAYGFLLGLGCSFPTKRSGRIYNVLNELYWLLYDWEYEGFNESDISEKIDIYSIALYTERYNEIKYWWMPSK